MVRIGERHMCCVEGIAGVPMWHAEGRESYVVRRGGRVVCSAQRGGKAYALCRGGEQAYVVRRGESRGAKRGERV